MTTRPDPALTRFLRKVDVTPDGCWLWQAGRTPDGYGQFHVGSRVDGTRRNVNAHRWIYQQLVGSIAHGLHLDHLCRVRHCVNPEHLEPVTPKINTLRGETVSAANAAKVACAQGHPLSGENLRIRSDGHRACRTCVRRWDAERYARDEARRSRPR